MDWTSEEDWQIESILILSYFIFIVASLLAGFCWLFTVFFHPVHARWLILFSSGAIGRNWLFAKCVPHFSIKSLEKLMRNSKCIKNGKWMFVTHHQQQHQQINQNQDSDPSFGENCFLHYFSHGFYSLCILMMLQLECHVEIISNLRRLIESGKKWNEIERGKIEKITNNDIRIAIMTIYHIQYQFKTESLSLCISVSLLVVQYIRNKIIT